MAYEVAEIDPIRQPLYQRIRRFAARTSNDDLRALMWRLGKIVADRDCPNAIDEDCKPLYGLVGERLKEQLLPLLSDYESRISRRQKSRARLDALRIAKGVSVPDQPQIEKPQKRRDRVKALTQDMVLSDHLRDFYFSLSVDDLQAIWNSGDNGLRSDEVELARIALRNKLGIRSSEGPAVQMCSQCFLTKDACACEKGGW